LSEKGKNRKQDHEAGEGLIKIYSHSGGHRNPVCLDSYKLNTSLTTPSGINPDPPCSPWRTIHQPWPQSLLHPWPSPITPGDVLLEEFLKPMEIAQNQLGAVTK